MSDILLAKPTLAEDWIDASVGEAQLVKRALYDTFGLEQYQLPSSIDMEYPYPNGYAPLVKLLEDKHQAPVIITNGAKQALAACFYALKQMGKQTIGMRSPYWALIPPLVEMHGLQWKASNPLPDDGSYDSYLCVAPNNPDGWIRHPYLLFHNMDSLKDEGIPVIHDAVYYNHVYLPVEWELNTIGNVQIYSISKMFGLSGLRVGYVVCSDTVFYHHIKQYIETMTVGVSILSQIYVYDLMSHMKLSPHLNSKFEQTAANDLRHNKEILLQISSKVLEVPFDIVNTAGMFLWAKTPRPELLIQAKVNVMHGVHFGSQSQDNFVRINLALLETQIEEIINRLNAIVI